MKRFEGRYHGRPGQIRSGRGGVRALADAFTFGQASDR
jgi:hypothetical protein